MVKVKQSQFKYYSTWRSMVGRKVFKLPKCRSFWLTDWVNRTTTTAHFSRLNSLAV